MSFIYLASPYADPDPRVRKERFQKTVDATARLILKGIVVFSPIVHNFTITLKSSLEMGWDQWRDYDLHMIDASLCIWVLNLDGWVSSQGVTAELEYAFEIQKPMWVCDYETLKTTEFTTVVDASKLDQYDSVLINPKPPEG